jgi:adenylate cyclase
MAGLLQLRIYEGQELVYSLDFLDRVELGRQSERDDEPYSQKQEADRWRVVVARRNEQSISRRHVLFERLADGQIRVTNLSATIALRLQDGVEFKPGASGEVPLPVVLAIGRRTVRVQEGDTEGIELQSLSEVTMPPGSEGPSSSRFPALVVPAGGHVDNKAMVRWLQATMAVFHSAASSSDFFPKAAQAVVDMVGLDSGSVLLLEQGEWRTQARRTAAQILPDMEWKPSRWVLNKLSQEKRTFWEVPRTTGVGPLSLRGIRAVVAAPILDRGGRVIGALYGDRRREGSAALLAPITELDAMLVELLASGVAAGLARLEHEKAALAQRVQFEQFFTPELSRQLAAEPDLLKGRDSEVTLLFCDIRGFSRVSERLGTAGTVEWVSDIMEALSECVLAHSGVLVDYIGDELMAMWGAPQVQPEHAQLACRAALDMLSRVPELNDRWRERLGESFGLGIGINTGVARVGNTGSTHKFKYGPLGNSVNLASRVQGATKYLQAKLLITGGTRARLDAEFETRRLCEVRVVNIAEPVALHELVLPGQLGWSELKDGYEKALAEFEKHDFRSAARILGNLLGQYPDDGPALLLLSRAVQALIEKPAEFDPVWDLPGK